MHLSGSCMHGLLKHVQIMERRGGFGMIILFFTLKRLRLSLSLSQNSLCSPDLIRTAIVGLLRRQSKHERDKSNRFDGLTEPDEYARQ